MSQREQQIKAMAEVLETYLATSRYTKTIDEIAIELLEASERPSRVPWPSDKVISAMINYIGDYLGLRFRPSMSIVTEEARDTIGGIMLNDDIIRAAIPWAKSLPIHSQPDFLVSSRLPQAAWNLYKAIRDAGLLR